MLDSVVLRAMPLAVLVALPQGPAGAADGEKSVSRGWGGSRRPGLRHLPRGAGPGPQRRRISCAGGHAGCLAPQSRSRIFEVAPA